MFDFDIFMKKWILLISLTLGVVFGVLSQINESDTIVLESIERFPIDSITLVNQIDTLNKKPSVDSSHVSIEDSLSATTNKTVATIKKDSVVQENIVGTYEDFLKQFSDTVFFNNYDTSFYVISRIENILSSDSLFINDSLYQAINMLNWYYKSRDIRPVISYLDNKVNSGSDTVLEFPLRSKDDEPLNKDSVLVQFRDSLYNSVRYLLKSIPEDSVRLSIINSKKDTVFIKRRRSEIDSTRIGIYDKRGEFAMLWIKKGKGRNIHLQLDEGIYIDKPKQRKTVKQEIDVVFDIPGLKKMKKVNILVPIWEFKSMADIRFNQGYLENWAEGGENSMSALAIFKSNLSYSYGKLRNWENTLEYRLGYLKAGENPIQKNDDKLEFNSKYGRTAFKDWYYSALLNFKTQLLEGYDYPNDSVAVSEFLSPAYLVFSLGLDYKPSKKLTILISPITSKFTIVADTINYDQTRFGVGEDEYIRKEIGAYVKAISIIKFTKNIELKNKLNFFTNYVDKPQNIDVDWEADLAVKLNDNIKVSVNAHMIYDDDVNYVDKDGEVHGPRLQFKEMLGVGFIYTF